ncbi:Ceramidase [Parasponia andersonii]|uniref:Ceramidase n=1 Tax=Parasponia andersonii TaxID=3476 RepID=A0A2P5C5V5_PARAD|nr:Ceramidase [Parasponia andersonii]
MVWLMNHQLGTRWTRTRIWAGAFLLWLFFMVVTPKISLSPKHHLFADMRNFLGVPSTLNVITNFPFLVVGVLGFVLCVQGEFFNISLRGEVWGWALFYAGIVGVAFGSAYYHLKPSNDRVMWDTLPMMIAYSSLFSSCITERVGEKIGLTCLFALLFAAFLSSAYERTYNDLRLCMMFQLIPLIAIPAIAIVYQSKYTHSRYWLWATCVYFLSKFEAVADRKIYHANHYFISGHSLEHLCLALVPILFSLMLIYRSNKNQRIGELRERP